MAARVKGFEVYEPEGDGSRVATVHLVDLAGKKMKAEMHRPDGTFYEYEGDYEDFHAFNPKGERVPIEDALRAVGNEVTGAASKE